MMEVATTLGIGHAWHLATAPLYENALNFFTTMPYGPLSLAKGPPKPSKLLRRQQPTISALSSLSTLLAIWQTLNSGQMQEMQKSSITLSPDRCSTCFMLTRQKTTRQDGPKPRVIQLQQHQQQMLSQKPQMPATWLV
jgi:hypothetical protein